MITDTHLGAHVSDEDGHGGLDWYINKSIKCSTIKVLQSAIDGARKMRLMQEILRGHPMPNARQAVVEGALHGNAQESGYDHGTVSTASLTDTDEDDKIGKMTLKEICRLLRQRSGKAVKKQNCVPSSSAPSPGTDSNTECKDLECSSSQLGALELFLDSSTSNSAESGDELSPRGVATSCHKPVDIVQLDCGREDACPDFSSRNQKPFACPLLFEAKISVEDDECTLQMWQAHRQRVRGGKRYGGHGVEQVGTPVGSLTPSSPSPATESDVCNVDDIFTVVDVDKSLHNVGRCLSGASPGTSIPCSIACQESSKDSSLGSSHGVISADDSPGLDLIKPPEDCSRDGERECIANSDGNSCSISESAWAIRRCKVSDGSESADMRKVTAHSDTVMQENEASIVSSAVESTSTSLQFSSTAMAISEPAYNPAGNGNLFQKPSFEDVAPSPLGEEPPGFGELKPGRDSDVNIAQNIVTACQSSSNEIASPPIFLFSTESVEAEEDQESLQLKPSKIPCKRKAISPLSRERLLQASKSGDCEPTVSDAGLRKLPRAFKGFIGGGALNHRSMDGFRRDCSALNTESSPPEKALQKSDSFTGSPCHNRKKFVCGKSFAPKVPSSYSDSVVARIAVAPPSPTCEPAPSCVQRLSLVLNSSPSPPLQHIPTNFIHGKSPTNSSPSVPTKGILRSSPPTCRGACRCEECESLRCRAERAAEFSQRQMHDIESLAVRLLKELNTMRCVVEESLIQRAAGTHPASSPEQARRAANNALETEKMAKTWLVRMARDCNRYCKIMRMQERKLTFADESGGQLCHIKLFHSHSKPQKDGMISDADREKSCQHHRPTTEIAAPLDRV